MELNYEYSRLSGKEFAKQIVKRLESRFGIDLRSIYENDQISDKQKVRKARVVLAEAILDEADRSASRADFAPPPDFDEDGFLTQLLSEEVDIEPNITISEHNVRYLMTLTGNDVKTYLFNLTKRFENMAAAKTPGELAIETSLGGMISVGVPAAVIAVRAYRAGTPLLGAIRAGITGIGMKTAIGAAVVILACLLLYLLLENPKKILGMVINDTTDHFVVKDWQKGAGGAKDGDLFMQHGQMVDFMQDNENERLDSPKIQLRGKFDFGPGDPDNAVFAGIYFADRNFGLRGSEGVMIFGSTTSNLRFAHMFAVPYFNDNGTNIQLVTQPVADIEVLYRDLYNSRGTSIDKSEGGYRLTSRANDPRGGVVGCIAAISKQAG